MCWYVANHHLVLFIHNCFCFGLGLDFEKLHGLGLRLGLDFVTLISLYDMIVGYNSRQVTETKTPIILTLVIALLILCLADVVAISWLMGMNIGRGM